MGSRSTKMLKREDPEPEPELSDSWTPNVLSLVEELRKKNWGHLHFGKYPKDPELVTNMLNIDTFVNLTEPFERDKFPEAKNTLYYPIVETKVPMDIDSFLSFLDMITTKIKNGKNIFVHCYNGRGRTGIFMVLLVTMLTSWELKSCYELVYKAHRLGHGQKHHWENIMLPPRSIQKLFVSEAYELCL